MTKTYIDAKLQIVPVNNDIVTASIGIGNPINEGNPVANTPERRRSIWE